MVANVSDFGIAKLLGGRDSMTQTMTLATIGYMAPEYGMEGMVTTRGDVYSFGIVLLETFTKRKPTDEMFDGEVSLKKRVANSLFADVIVEVVDGSYLGLKKMSFCQQERVLTNHYEICSCLLCRITGSMQEALATLNKIKIKFLMDAAGGLLLNHRLIAAL
ncbi:receptor-like serine/threonine-protein kinase At1g78530 [Rosa rugosa]|uniref:receptor-like serine/threonine-protein kinase At1g78530 n=1 Tax=Rosa rugosa TaxID=74645 RepID=UPI002B409EBD|nr:receptor-like serine/threonine-protein kinase At1g78530 [Rosa rugosa]